MAVLINFVDSISNRVIAPAPLFDHGNSLFNFAGEDFMKSEDSLEAYIRTLQPCVYDDFIATASSFMSDDNREQLWHLLTFKFKRHSRYNLPNHDLTLIEKQVRKRAGLLLG